MKKKHSGPQIVAKLRQADIFIGQGRTITKVCKIIDVIDATYYRWRQKYSNILLKYPPPSYSFPPKISPLEKIENSSHPSMGAHILKSILRGAGSTRFSFFPYQNPIHPSYF